MIGRPFCSFSFCSCIIHSSHFIIVIVPLWCPVVNRLFAPSQEPLTHVVLYCIIMLVAITGQWLLPHREQSRQAFRT